MIYARTCNLHVPRPKAPKAFLERMHNRMYNLEKNPIKTHIIPEFPGNPRSQKCKIPVVRSSKPAFLQWNLHLNITNLHFPRPKAPKAFLERMHNRMYNLEKKHQNPYNTSNAFGHFGLGKCKLVILRCRFHCKNAGFEDLTTGILHFWFLGFPGNPGIIWGVMGFFLGCIFCCAFFPGMPLDMLVLENVSW